nr:unnamed protein product [Callosobruchus analis]
MEYKQGQNISEQVRTLCREKLGIHLSEDNIETCFRCGRGGNGKRAVLFTVNSYSLKLLLLKSRNKLKGTKITVAEDMAPLRFNLYKKAIQKYDKRSVWFYDGKIWVKNGRRRFEIKTEEDLIRSS